jgi:hypothetical protein
MKKAILLPCLLFCYYTYSQATFDERFDIKDSRTDVHSISVDPNNENIIIAGRVLPLEGGQSNLVLNVIDKNGNLIWSKIYDASFSPGNIKCIVAKNKDILILAQLTGADHFFDTALIMRIDKRGNVLQAKKIQADLYKIARTGSIAQDSAGGFAISYDAQISTGSAVISVIYLIKILISPGKKMLLCKKHRLIITAPVCSYTLRQEILPLRVSTPGIAHHILQTGPH